MRQTRWPFVVLLGLLVVIAAVAAWDYVEVWRLDSELARIESLGEPTTAARLDSTTTNPQETAASRYYRAALALVDNERSPGPNEFQVRLGHARRSNEWPEDLLEEMRRRVTANEEALRYLDKAATLEFEGFPESAAMYASWAYHLQTLLPVADLRTTILAVEGKSDAAALSLYSAVRLQRTMAFWSLHRPGLVRNSVARRSDPLALIYLTRQLQMVVSRTQPSVEILALLAQGFAALDNDDLLLHDLLWLRAASRINLENPRSWLRRSGVGVGAFKLGESITTSIQMPLYRPFLLHSANQRLRRYGDAIAAQAGKGWPEKMDAVAKLEAQLSAGLSGHAQQIARELALIRSARTIIAIEQYRRTNGERIPENWNALSNIQAPLIDPHSGQPLKFFASGGRYVVYSIGPNRRDDGGDVDVQAPPTGQRTQPPTDVGISVAVH